MAPTMEIARAETQASLTIGRRAPEGPDNNTEIPCNANADVSQSEGKPQAEARGRLSKNCLIVRAYNHKEAKFRLLLVGFLTGDKSSIPNRKQTRTRHKTPCDARWPSNDSDVQRTALASATVSAVMLTIRRTVAEGVRMCTGLAAPSSTGPMAMPPPAVVLSRL